MNLSTDHATSTSTTTTTTTNEKDDHDNKKEEEDDHSSIHGDDNDDDDEDDVTGKYNAFLNLEADFVESDTEDDSENDDPQDGRMKKRPLHHEPQQVQGEDKQQQHQPPSPSSLLLQVEIITTATTTIMDSTTTTPIIPSPANSDSTPRATNTSMDRLPPLPSSSSCRSCEDGTMMSRDGEETFFSLHSLPEQDIFFLLPELTIMTTTTPAAKNKAPPPPPIPSNVHVTTHDYTSWSQDEHEHQQQQQHEEQDGPLHPHPPAPPSSKKTASNIVQQTNESWLEGWLHRLTGSSSPNKNNNNNDSRRHSLNLSISRSLISEVNEETERDQDEIDDDDDDHHHHYPRGGKDKEELLLPILSTPSFQESSLPPPSVPTTRNLEEFLQQHLSQTKRYRHGAILRQCQEYYQHELDDYRKNTSQVQRHSAQQLDELEHVLSSVQEEKSQLQHVVDQMTLLVQQGTTELTQARQGAELWKDQFQAAQEQLQVSRHRLDTLKEEVVTRNQQITTLLHDYDVQMEHVHESQQETEHQLKTALRETVELQDHLQVLTHRLELATSQVSALEAQDMSRQEHLTQLEAKNVTLNSALHVTRWKMGHVLVMVKKEKEQLLQQVQQFEQQMIQFHKDKARVVKEVDGWKKKYHEAQDLADELQDTNGTLESLVDATKTRLVEQDQALRNWEIQWQEQTEQTRRELLALQESKVQEQEQQQQQWHDERNELQEKLASIVTEWHDYQTQADWTITDLTKKLDTANESKKQTSQQLEWTKLEKVDLEHQVNDLQQSVDTGLDKISGLEYLVLSSQTTSTELERQLGLVQAEKKQVLDDIHQLQIQFEQDKCQLGNDVHDWQQQHVACNEQVQTLQEAMVTWERRVYESEERLVEKDQALQEWENRWKDFEQQQAHEVALRDAKTLEWQTLWNELQVQLEGTCQELEEQRNHSHERIAALSNVLEDAKNKSTTVQMERDQLQSDLEAARSTILALQTEKKDLHRQWRVGHEDALVLQANLAASERRIMLLEGEYMERTKVLEAQSQELASVVQEKSILEQSVDEWKTSVEASTVHLANLEHKWQATQEQSCTLQQDNDRLRPQLQENQAVLADLSSQVSATKDKIESMQKELDRAKLKLKKRDTEVLNLKARLEDSAHLATMLRDETLTLKRQEKGLQLELAEKAMEWTAAVQNVHQWKEQHDEAVVQIDRLEVSHAAFVRLFDESEERATRVSVRLVHCESEVERLRQEKEGRELEWEHTMDKFTKQTAALQLQNVKLSASLEETLPRMANAEVELSRMAELARALATTEETVRSLRLESEADNVRRKEYEKLLDESEERNTRVSVCLADCEAEIERLLQEKVDTQAQLGATLDDLEEQRRMAEETRIAFELQRQELENEIASLQNANDRLGSPLLQNDMVTRAISRVTGRGLAESPISQSSSKSEKDDVRELPTEMGIGKEVLSQNDESANKLLALEQAYAEVLEEKSALEDRGEKLKTYIDDAAQQLTEFEHQLMASDDEIAALHHEKSILSAQLQEGRAIIATLEIQVKKSQDRINDLESQFLVAQGAVQGMNLKIEESESHAKKLESQISDMNALLQEKHNLIASLEGEMASLESDVGGLKSCVEDFAQQLSNTKLNEEKAHGERDVEKSKVQQLESSKDHLEDLLKDSETRNASVSVRLESQLQEKESVIASFEEKIVALEKEVDFLKSTAVDSARDLGDAKNDAEKVKEELDKEKAKKLNLESTKTRLEGLLEESEARSASVLAKLEFQISGMDALLQVKADVIATCEEKIASLTSEVEVLKSSADDSARELGDAKNNAEKVTEELINEKTEKLKLASSKIRLEGLLEESDSRTKNLRTHLESQNALLEERATVIASFEEKMASFESEVEVLKFRAENSDRELNDARLNVEKTMEEAAEEKAKVLGLESSKKHLDGLLEESKSRTTNILAHLESQNALLQEKADEIPLLEEKMSSLENEVEALKSRADESAREIIDAKLSTHKVREELDEEKSNVLNLESSKTRLESLLEDSEATATSFSVRLVQSEAALESLLKLHEAKVSSLSEELGEQSLLAEKLVEDFERQLNASQLQVSSLQVDNAGLTSRLVESESGTAKLQVAMEAAGVRNAASESRTAKAEVELQKLHEELAAAIARTEEITSEKTAELNELHRALASVEGEKSALENRVENFKAIVDDSALAATEAKRDAMMWQSQREESELKLQELFSMPIQFERQQKESNAEIQKLSDRVDEKEIELHLLRKDKEMLHSRLHMEVAERGRADRMSLDAGRKLQKEIDTLLDEKESLGARLGEIHLTIGNVYNEMKAAASTIADLESQLNDSDARERALMDEQVDSQGRMRALEELMTNSISHAKELELEVEDIGEERSTLETIVQELQATLGKSREESDNLKRDVRTFIADLKIAESKIQELELRKTELERFIRESDAQRAENLNRSSLAQVDGTIREDSPPQGKIERAETVCYAEATGDNINEKTSALHSNVQSFETTVEDPLRNTATSTKDIKSRDVVTHLPAFGVKDDDSSKVSDSSSSGDAFALESPDIPIVGNKSKLTDNSRGSSRKSTSMSLTWSNETWELPTVVVIEGTSLTSRAQTECHLGSNSSVEVESVGLTDDVRPQPKAIDQWLGGSMDSTQDQERDDESAASTQSDTSPVPTYKIWTPPVIDFKTFASGMSEINERQDSVSSTSSRLSVESTGIGPGNAAEFPSVEIFSDTNGRACNIEVADADIASSMSEVVARWLGGKTSHVDGPESPDGSDMRSDSEHAKGTKYKIWKPPAFSFDTLGTNAAEEDVSSDSDSVNLASGIALGGESTRSQAGSSEDLNIWDAPDIPITGSYHGMASFESRRISNHVESFFGYTDGVWALPYMPVVTNTCFVRNLIDHDDLSTASFEQESVESTELSKPHRSMAEVVAQWLGRERSGADSPAPSDSSSSSTHSERDRGTTFEIWRPPVLDFKAFASDEIDSDDESVSSSSTTQIDVAAKDGEIIAPLVDAVVATGDVRIGDPESNPVRSMSEVVAKWLGGRKGTSYSHGSSDDSTSSSHSESRAISYEVWTPPVLDFKTSSINYSEEIESESSDSSTSGVQNEQNEGEEGEGGIPWVFGVPPTGGDGNSHPDSQSSAPDTGESSKSLSDVVAKWLGTDIGRGDDRDCSSSSAHSDNGTVTTYDIWTPPPLDFKIESVFGLDESEYSDAGSSTSTGTPIEASGEVSATLAPQSVGAFVSKDFSLSELDPNRLYSPRDQSGDRGSSGDSNSSSTAVAEEVRATSYATRTPPPVMFETLTDPKRDIGAGHSTKSIEADANRVSRDFAQASTNGDDLTHLSDGSQDGLGGWEAPDIPTLVIDEDIRVRQHEQPRSLNQLALSTGDKNAVWEFPALPVSASTLLINHSQNVGHHSSSTFEEDSVASPLHTSSSYAAEDSDVIPDAVAKWLASQSGDLALDDLVESGHVSTNGDDLTHLSDGSQDGLGGWEAPDIPTFMMGDDIKGHELEQPRNLNQLALSTGDNNALWEFPALPVSASTLLINHSQNVGHHSSSTLEEDSVTSAHDVASRIAVENSDVIPDAVAKWLASQSADSSSDDSVASAPLGVAATYKIWTPPGIAFDAASIDSEGVSTEGLSLSAKDISAGDIEAVAVGQIQRTDDVAASDEPLPDAVATWLASQSTDSSSVDSVSSTHFDDVVAATFKIWIPPAFDLDPVSIHSETADSLHGSSLPRVVLEHVQAVKENVTLRIVGEASLSVVHRGEESPSSENVIPSVANESEGLISDAVAKWLSSQSSTSSSDDSVESAPPDDVAPTYTIWTPPALDLDAESIRSEESSVSGTAERSRRPMEMTTRVTDEEVSAGSAEPHDEAPRATDDDHFEADRLLDAYNEPIPDAVMRWLSSQGSISSSHGSVSSSLSDDLAETHKIWTPPAIDLDSASINSEADASDLSYLPQVALGTVQAAAEGVIAPGVEETSVYSANKGDWLPSKQDIRSSDANLSIGSAQSVGRGLESGSAGSVSRSSGSSTDEDLPVSQFYGEDPDSEGSHVLDFVPLDYVVHVLDAQSDGSASQESSTEDSEFVTRWLESQNVTGVSDGAFGDSVVIRGSWQVAYGSSNFLSSSTEEPSAGNSDVKEWSISVDNSLSTTKEQLYQPDEVSRSRTGLVMDLIDVDVASVGRTDTSADTSTDSSSDAFFDCDQGDSSQQPDLGSEHNHHSMTLQRGETPLRQEPLAADLEFLDNEFARSYVELLNASEVAFPEEFLVALASEAGGGRGDEEPMFSSEEHSAPPHSSTSYDVRSTLEQHHVQSVWVSEAIDSSAEYSPFSSKGRYIARYNSGELEPIRVRQLAIELEMHHHERMYLSKARYSGPMVNGLPHGQGVVWFDDTGCLYVGEFQHGEMHGVGIFNQRRAGESRNEVLQGDFIHNEFAGPLRRVSVRRSTGGGVGSDVEASVFQFNDDSSG
jgi:chromosome segregation ATPase